MLTLECCEKFGSRWLHPPPSGRPVRGGCGQYTPGETHPRRSGNSFSQNGGRGAIDDTTSPRIKNLFLALLLAFLM